MPRPILHVAPHLWSGAGGVITRLCEHQRRRRPVVVATTGGADGTADWPAYRSRLRRAGIRTVTLDSFHRDPAIYWTSVRQLAALIDELRPTVVHAHAGVPAALAAVARTVTRRRPRLVAQMYSWGTGRPEWMDHHDAWAFAQADVTVCSAHAYRRILRALGVPAARLVYLPWGLPLDELQWRPTPDKGTPDHPGPVIGFVGRLEPRKGQLDLVEALAQIRRRLPTARLELVGPVADRAYAADIRRASRRLGVERAVSLTGLVHDVPARLRTWNLFVSLSSDEGQGLAVLEAMAVGVPVAARVVPGIEDFLDDGRTGWGITGRSPVATARTVQHALDDIAGSRAIAGRARRMVERRYDWTAMVAAFTALYRG